MTGSVADPVSSSATGGAIFGPRPASVMAGTFVLLAVLTAAPLHSTGSEIILRIAYAALFAGLLLIGRCGMP